MENQAWQGKRLRIFFNDLGRVIAKYGVCISYDNIFLTIRTDSGLTEILPVDKIQRCEGLNLK